MAHFWSKNLNNNLTYWNSAYIISFFPYQFTYHSESSDIRCYFAHQPQLFLLQEHADDVCLNMYQRKFWWAFKSKYTAMESLFYCYSIITELFKGNGNNKIMAYGTFSKQNNKNNLQFVWRDWEKLKLAPVSIWTRYYSLLGCYFM